MNKLLKRCKICFYGIFKEMNPNIYRNAKVNFVYLKMAVDLDECMQIYYATAKSESGRDI